MKKSISREDFVKEIRGWVENHLPVGMKLPNEWHFFGFGIQFKESKMSLPSIHCDCSEKNVTCNWSSSSWSITEATAQLAMIEIVVKFAARLQVEVLDMYRFYEVI